MCKLNFQLEQAIGMHVNRTAFLMTEEIAQRFSSHGYGLSAQDFGILFRLAGNNAMTQVEIAALMMRDKTTITRRIDGLVKKGLTIRTAKPDDRRCFHINLTLEGIKALQVLTPLVRNFQQEVLANVSESDRETTLNVLTSISDNLIKHKKTGTKS